MNGTYGADTLLHFSENKIRHITKISITKTNVQKKKIKHMIKINNCLLVQAVDGRHW